MGSPQVVWPIAKRLFSPPRWGRPTFEVNPSFAISIVDAKRLLARMADQSIPLSRPLLIITGFMDPGFAATTLRRRFHSLSRDSRIIAVSLAECLSFEGCRRKILGAVERAFPPVQFSQAPELDVIGYSLGGVAARYAALPTEPGGGRLQIRRLFTISTPHRGARRAQQLPLLHPLQRHLRPGSPLLERINATDSHFQVFPYIRLGDHSIGESNAAPPGQSPWWLDTPPLSDAHNGAHLDPRILADIARRLRDEPPLASQPPAPLPANWLSSRTSVS